MLIWSLNSCFWILSSISFFICSSSVITGDLFSVGLAEIWKLGLSKLCFASSENISGLDFSFCVLFKSSYSPIN